MSEEITTADMGEDSYSQEVELTPDNPDVDLSAEQPGLEEQVAPEDDTEPPPVSTGEEEKEVKEPEIDEVPAVDKEALSAEIEELEKKRNELKEKAALEREKYIKWRDAGRDARAARFQQREPKPPPETLPDEGEETRQPTVQRPIEEDFENYNDYVDALTDWKVEQKLADYDRKVAERSEETYLEEKHQEFRAKLGKGYEKYEDFEEVAFDEIVPITPFMADVLVETEIPADIAYYLGKNIPECTSIANMSPIQAVKAIGLIEEKLKGQSQEEEPVVKDQSGKPPAPKPKPTTKAPAPITPVPPGSATVSKDPSRMTNEEYRQWRRSRSGG